MRNFATDRFMLTYKDKDKNIMACLCFSLVGDANDWIKHCNILENKLEIIFSSEINFTKGKLYFILFEDLLDNNNKSFWMCFSYVNCSLWIFKESRTKSPENLMRHKKSFKHKLVKYSQFCKRQFVQILPPKRLLLFKCNKRVKNLASRQQNSKKFR